MRTFSCAEGMSSASRSLSVGCFEATDKKRAEATERTKGELVYTRHRRLLEDKIKTKMR